MAQQAAWVKIIHGPVLISIGVDIVSILRMKKIIGNIDLSQNESVLNSVFTQREITRCSALRNPHKHYALRLAGKEAFLKALGTGLKKDFLFSDIEFLNDKHGNPYAICYGDVEKEILKNHIKRIIVSWSDSREKAVAVVILEK